SCEPLSHFRLWAVGSPTLAKPFVVVKICFTWFIQFGSCQNSQGSTTSEPGKPRFSAGRVTRSRLAWLPNCGYGPKWGLFPSHTGQQLEHARFTSHLNSQVLNGREHFSFYSRSI